LCLPPVVLWNEPDRGHRYEIVGKIALRDAGTAKGADAQGLVAPPAPASEEPPSMMSPLRDGESRQLGQDDPKRSL